ncbi:hypothetical protein VNO77_19391 [Canavalia gladiata]|uniref:Uncharacterized protein n=1 Tax=Canavalia gladiata TaxID=3824 RepID=A0AAN9LME6_CANGL
MQVGFPKRDLEEFGKEKFLFKLFHHSLAQEARREEEESLNGAFHSVRFKIHSISCGSSSINQTLGPIVVAEGFIHRCCIGGAVAHLSCPTVRALVKYPKKTLVDPCQIVDGHHELDKKYNSSNEEDQHQDCEGASNYPFQVMTEFRGLSSLIHDTRV